MDPRLLEAKIAADPMTETSSRYRGRPRAAIVAKPSSQTHQKFAGNRTSLLIADHETPVIMNDPDDDQEPRRSGRFDD